MTEEATNPETTSKDETESTTEENLAKMKSILANLKAKRTKVGIMAKKAAVRHSNAKVDVLVRRFAFDLSQLKDQIEELDGKIAWTKNLIGFIEMQLNLKASTNQKGELVHKPFAALGALLA